MIKKELLKEILSCYIKEYPTEIDKINKLNKYLNLNSEKAMSDWNNAKGHLTAGCFLYCKTTKRFLMVYHKDLKIYSYQGGHCEAGDSTPLERAIKELKEETGAQDFKLVQKTQNHDIPFDIDIHEIEYNARVGMPEHLHYDFRYLFEVNEEFDVVLDINELSTYKWITKKQLSQDVNFGHVVAKIDKLLEHNKLN